jgi:hypothetical protein
MKPDAAFATTMSNEPTAASFDYERKIRQWAKSILASSGEVRLRTPTMISLGVCEPASGGGGPGCAQAAERQDSGPHRHH